jgi:TRAP-type C4-dicarboxylate transport system permease small subunit
MPSAAPPHNLLRNLLRGIARFEVFITTAAFVVLIVVLLADVVVRRVTGSGLVWAREAGVFANIVLCIIGIGIASAQGAHLRPRFVDAWFPRKWDSALIRTQELLTAVAFGILAILSWGVVVETRELAEASTVLRLPVWPVQLCLPLAFGLATIRHALYGLAPDLRPAERGEDDIKSVAESLQSATGRS